MTEPTEPSLTLCSCGAYWSLPFDQHVPGIGVEHHKADPDERNYWHKLTRRERFRLLPGVHDLWFALTHWTGIRDRMRCPSCTAVGTWKMHGSLLERWIWKDIHVRRCLCKWCGYYTGPLGRVVAYLDTPGKVWAIPVPGVPRGQTPMEAANEAMGIKVWPWFG